MKDRMLTIGLFVLVPVGIAWWIYREATWVDPRQEPAPKDVPLEEYGAGPVHPAA